jgi:RHS repeat-associated protein
LGSTSLLSTASGSVVSGSISRYLPFGAFRGTVPTQSIFDRTYTGHKANNLGSGSTNLGLIYMNARYYIPSLHRFASADTLIPNPANPQSYNRYAYTHNSPLNFTTPTGQGAFKQTMIYTLFFPFFLLSNPYLCTIPPLPGFSNKILTVVTC